MSTRATGRTPGPLPYEWEKLACLDVVNTYRRDHRGSGAAIDRIYLPVWREAFLDRWGLNLDAPPGPAEVERLAALRALITRLLDGFSRGRRPAQDDLDELNRLMAGAPTVPRIEASDGGLRLLDSPLRRDWDGVLAAIAASTAALLAGGEPKRLKRCANDACGWMYYDETRSRTRRWCVGGICGSLVKVRRHRQKVSAPRPW